MSRKLYCFRLGKCVHLLTDEEFERVLSNMQGHGPAVMRYKKERAYSMDEARANAPTGIRALDAYERITGQRFDYQTS